MTPEDLASPDRFATAFKPFTAEDGVVHLFQVPACSPDHLERIAQNTSIAEPSATPTGQSLTSQPRRKKVAVMT